MANPGRIETTEQNARGTIRAALRSLATGLFGSVVIALFLQNFVQARLLAGLLPLVMSFNGAVAGFTMHRHAPADRDTVRAAAPRGTTPWLRSAALGGLTALVSLGVLSLLGLEALSREFFGVLLLVLACCGGLVSGVVGAWIAVKQTELAKAGT